MAVKNWRVNKVWRGRDVDAEQSVELARALGCSRILTDLLVSRGIDAPDEANRFMNPSLSDLHDPDSLPGIDKAVERITTAIRENQSVAIVGDYDVDGLSSTALLLEFFRFIDKPVQYYIPHRVRDGYGLNESVVRRLAEEGVDLIITVDNGSTALAAAEAAATLGVDLVVTDHHLPGDELPKAVTIVNPWLAGSEYPFRQLAGVGVTFKVVWALCRFFSRSRKVSPEFRTFMVESLALVALGTIADVMPLRDENRVLTRYGLRSLETTDRAGLRELVSLARRGEDDRPLTSEDVGFRMAPCLNAAGRLGDADDALRLLIARDVDDAKALVGTLKRQNDLRREIERDIHEEARATILEDYDPEDDRFFVLAREGWHPGVIGIVAARIVEEFYRPTLLIALEGEIGKGSARSIPQVEVCEALRQAKQCLSSFGGHAMAAGVQLDRDRVLDLRRALNAAVQVGPGEMIPEVTVDGEYALDEWTPEVLRDISRLEPFGEGNPQPRFATRDAQIVGMPRLMGSDEAHLSFHVRENGTSLRAVAFRMAKHFQGLCDPNARVSLVYRPKINRWANRSSLELMVDEMTLSDNGHENRSSSE